MAAIRILTGSVYGGALQTAKTIKETLEPEGHQVFVLESPSLDDITTNNDALLVCTSTTGQGELPPNLLPFYVDLKSSYPNSPAGRSALSCSATALMATLTVAPAI